MIKKIICYLFGHKWTSKATRGEKPDMTKGLIESFKEQAHMYCERCGYSSKLNNRLNNL